MKDYSNYHKVNINNKLLHDGKLIFQQGLKGFESEKVTIDGIEKTVMITSKYSSGDGSTRYILGEIADIYRGGVVKFNDETWLITSHPLSNKIYKKAEIKICGTSFFLTSEDKLIDTGKINEITGKPIYEKVPGEKTEVPCIFERTTSIKGTELAVNLPDGQANITIPYLVHEKLKIGLTLTFFGEDYQVDDIDYSKVYGDHGTIKLVAKKKVGEKT
ncbi:hypothetical protein NSA31_00310 [Bacillus subtilis]|uniref:hypothetical protein n=1 Tax=Bacillus TaxID=1386 RepID=UPI000772B460|nr:MULTISPECIES: hypothetical protein [Bacillus]WIT28011.1 hypothetical protein [Bacillus phage SPbetaL7]KXJ35265.1 hypothetical protein AX282_05955 [Bacillus spizizenii]MBJ3805218.1 hypothetical protein [Bacillus subtilis]MCR1990256.1 hypothetical protein [Bacillus subtilis]MDR4910629.1 hypothetical protein [Bacillus subtilis]